MIQPDRTNEEQQVQCLVCKSPAFCHNPHTGRWAIYKCSLCRLEFCHPMPDAEVLNAFYAEYRDPRAEETVVKMNAERNFSTLQKFGLSREHPLLDYGSGQGFFGRLGRVGHWANYDPYTADNDENLLIKNAYSWITLWGVLEHVVDPVGELKRLTPCLQSGGHLTFTTVWTETSIPYQHKPPEHVSYWTREAIRIALEYIGFNIRAFLPYVMVQKSDTYLQAVLRTVPEHLRNKIHHKLPDYIEVPTNEVFVVAQHQGNS